MSDNLHAQRLSAHIDQLLAHGQLSDLAAAPAEERALLSIAEQLISTRVDSQQTTRQALRQRLLQTPPATNAPATLRSKRRVALVIALVLLALLTVPAGRSFAHSLLVRVGLVAVTNAPTSAQQFIEQGSAAVPSETSQPTLAPPVLSSAQAYIPGWLPAGYQAEPSIDGMRYVLHDAQGSDFLKIYTLDAGSDELAVGAASVTPVSVRGADGAYIAGAPLYIKDKGGPMLFEDLEVEPYNLLLWPEDGHTIVIESARLEQADLLHIAAELTR